MAEGGAADSRAARDGSAGTGDALGLGAVVDDLWLVIDGRRSADPQESYTARLLTGPEDKLLKKIAEEAGEVLLAAKDNDREHLRYEAGDLLYHLLVVMARWGVTPDELAAELASRRK